MSEEADRIKVQECILKRSKFVASIQTAAKKTKEAKEMFNFNKT